MPRPKATYAAANLRPHNTPKDPNAGYELVKKLIFSQVWRFHAQYGGDVDELTSEANMAFVKGHEQFITGKRPSGVPLDTTYATEIRRWVWYEMFDKMRTRVRRNKVAHISSLDEMEWDAPDERTEWDGLAWAADLPADARYAAELVLAPDPEVNATAEAKGGNPRNYKSTVRQHLAAKGWKNDRINEAFEQIKRALG